jgi:hypothetical protein
MNDPESIIIKIMIELMNLKMIRLPVLAFGEINWA